MDALIAARVREVCVVVNYLADQIIEYIRSYPDLGLAVEYCFQKENLGTAHALATADAFLNHPVFVTAAGYAMQRDFLLHLKDTYHAYSADMVISLKEIPESEFRFRSLVQVDESWNIEELREKPEVSTGSRHIGASLIYIIPPSVGKYLEIVPLSVRGEYELPEVVNMMIQDGFSARGILQPAPKEWLG